MHSNLSIPTCCKCGSLFNTRSNLCAHKKTCTGKKVMNIPTLKHELDIAYKRIGELEAAQIKTKTFGTDDKTVAHVYLNNFRKEILDFVTHEFLREAIKAGHHDETLQDLLVKTHFNPDHPENMNVYMQDYSTVQVMFKNKWTTYTMKHIAECMVNEMASLMHDHADLETYPNEYTKNEVDHIDRWYRCNLRQERTVNQTIDLIKKHAHIANETLIKLGIGPKHIIQAQPMVE